MEETAAMMVQDIFSPDDEAPPPVVDAAPPPELPVELWNEILSVTFSKMENSEVGALRLVCKSFDALVRQTFKLRVTNASELEKAQLSELVSKFKAISSIDLTASTRIEPEELFNFLRVKSALANSLPSLGLSANMQAIQQQVTALRSLSSLKVKGWHVQQEWFDTLSAMSQLSSLHLEQCTFVNIGDSARWKTAFSKVAKLQSIDMSASEMIIRDFWLCPLSPLSDLQSVAFDNCAVTERCLDWIKMLQHLRRLSLRGVQLADAQVLKFIPHRLMFLDLSGNQLPSVQMWRHLKGDFKLRQAVLVGGPTDVGLFAEAAEVWEGWWQGWWS